MQGTQRNSPTYLTLAEDAAQPALAEDWIGKFVMLGRMAALWSREHPESQLVVALSVPVRDFAAVLVGCGWMSASAAPFIPPVVDVLETLPRHAPVRVVTQSRGGTPSRVFTERFHAIDIEKNRAGIGWGWQIDKLRAVVPLKGIDTARSQLAPEPGVFSKLTGMQKDWAARLCSPPQDLALVGTLKALSEDLTAYIGRGNEREPIANILLPEHPRAATWSTRIYPANQLDVGLQSADLRAALLDGASAVKYLPTIATPVVIAVLDRSVADVSVPEQVMNYRNTRGEPVSLEHDLRWKPPAGVEALGFEVPL